MAILKLNSNNFDKLEMGKLVVASADINLAIVYKDFPAGTVSVKTMVGNDPLQMIMFVAPGPRGADFTCGGAELILSKDAD